MVQNVHTYVSVQQSDIRLLDINDFPIENAQ